MHPRIQIAKAHMKPFAPLLQQLQYISALDLANDSMSRAWPGSKIDEVGRYTDFGL